MKRRKDRKGRLTIVLLVVLISAFAISSIVSRENNAEAMTTINVCVKRGDTLWTIARKYNTSGVDTRKLVMEIEKLNNIYDGVIYAGQIIKVPLS